ncbi:phage/plasmid replication protein, II/X family, partial [Photobacterium leiognathi]
RHPYQSLPTSFTGMAFKIFQGTPLRPACVELKASPAKIIQGHNVYGSTCLEFGALEMIQALIHTLPDFFDMLDVPNTTLDLLDCTFSARVANSSQVKQVINQLKNISHKQMRKSVLNEHETTCYFSRGSRHVDRKAYSKGDEFKRQFEQLKSKASKGDCTHNRMIEVMSNPELQNFARNLIRFECSAKRRYLDEFNVPKNLFDAITFQYEYEENGSCLITDIWKKAFQPLLESLQGQTMNIFNDDEVYSKLKHLYKKALKPKIENGIAYNRFSYAKADRVFRFYRSLVSDGYDTVKDTFSAPRTFYDNLNLLLDAGFSKAQLQNLKGNGLDNVVPLLQVIEIDFNNQRPSNWVEPTPPILAAYESGDFEALSNVVAFKAA